MDEFIKKTSGNDELEEILAQVKKSKQDAGNEEPSKTWSIDDIDKLIAQTNGEEYVPKSKEPATPAKDFERILSREFDTGIFTLKPIVEEPKEEMQDISSVSEDLDVDGQERFFEKEEDEFDEALFEIETVIVPEDIPEPSHAMFAWQEPEKKSEEKKEPAEIKAFYDDDASAEKIFGKSEEKKEENVHIKESDYKTRFFTTLKLEQTAEIEPVADGPVDRSGIIVKKSGEADESGLEAMPRVLAAEDAKEIVDEKTRVMDAVGSSAKKQASMSDDVEGQIVLTGFDTGDETVPVQQSEGDVEVQLWEKRKQKAKNFKLIEAIDLDSDFDDGDYEAPPEDVAKAEKARKRKEKKLEQAMEEEKPVANEYSSPAERASIHKRLSDEARKATTGLVSVGAVALVTLIVNLIPGIAEKLSIETQMFVEGSTAMCVINAVLLIVAAALDNVKFVDGLTGIFKKKIISSTAVSLTIVVALLQNTLAAVIGGSGTETAVFSAAAVFAVLIGKLADKMDAERILGNFEVCAYKYEHNMYAVHPFENESEIFELGRGLMMGNAELLYSSKLAFPSDFVKNSKTESGDKKLMQILIPAAFGAAAIVAIIAGIVEKSVMSAFSAFACTFCMSAPVFSSFIPAFIARSSNHGLNVTGTMIASLDAAEKTSLANAVVLDSADIFDRSRCTMHGMKDFKNIRIDDVLLYAAALIIKSGGPLRESFEQVVDGRQDLLPPVKELVYEDKLGIAARIHNQKVLLGNRNLLVNHNIEVPEKALEERYSHSGRKVMYLAVAGKIAALFVVSYAVDKNLEGYLKLLESNGIQILVRTNDVNVTEELISESFGIPKQNFKVLSSVAGRLFKRRRDAVSDRLPARIIHDGTAYSMLRAVAASCNIVTKKKLGSVIQIVLTALAFILCAALYCTSLGYIFSGLTAVLFLGIGLAISAGLMLIGKIK
ncbi:MAG: hypothetical protein IJE74_02355 [Clostridia bacterium]|nr:hypothetical protein [Clostridia bacterium]